MTIKLTARDKKLLVFLGLFIIIVGLGYFAVRPLLNSIEDTKTAIEAAEIEKEEREEKLMLLPSARRMKTILEERLAEATADFYAPMQSQEIDRLLTTMAGSYLLNRRKLSISSPEALSLAPYYTSEAAKSGGDAPAFTAITKVGIGMEVSGEKEALWAFLNDLFHNYPSIRVTSYSWSVSYGIGEDQEGCVLTLGLELYRYEG